jgi:hypothetical protein
MVFLKQKHSLYTHNLRGLLGQFGCKSRNPRPVSSPRHREPCSRPVWPMLRVGLFLELGLVRPPAPTWPSPGWTKRVTVTFCLKQRMRVGLAPWRTAMSLVVVRMVAQGVGQADTRSPLPRAHHCTAVQCSATLGNGRALENPAGQQLVADGW